METLEIEDLKHLLEVIGIEIICMAGTTTHPEKEQSLVKSFKIIEQMIKDREFEQSQTTLPKL